MRREYRTIPRPALQGILPLVVAGFLAPALQAPVHGASHSWTGASTSGLWSVPSNWEGNSPPFANESPLHLVFPAGAARFNSTNNIANLAVDSLRVEADGYLLAGFGSGTNLALRQPAGFNPATVVLTTGNGGSPVARFHSSLNLALRGDVMFHVASSGQITVNSTLRDPLHDAGGVTKLGGGTLELAPRSGANTYSGATSVQQGTLRLDGYTSGPGGPVPVVSVPGPLIIGGADPGLHSFALVASPDQIDDDAAVTVGRSGALTLQNVNEAIGGLTLSGGTVNTMTGTLRFNGDVTSHNSPGPGGTPVASDIHGRLDLGLISRRFDCIDATGTLNIKATIRGGAFAGVGAGIAKLGAGRLSLHSSNSYSGGTHISAGTLVANDRHALGTTNAPVTAGTNTILRLLDGEDLTNNPTFSGKRLVLHHGATVIPSHSCQWAGPVELTGGSAAFNSDYSVPGTAVLTISGTISGPGGFNLLGNLDLWLAGPDDNTYTGRTFVRNGRLLLLQGGFGPSRASIPGPLVIGHPTAQNLGTAIVESYKSDTITGASVAVNADGMLLLKAGVSETLEDLAVNSGEVDTGTGLLTLAGNLASTNSFLPGRITGRLDLGNSPRQVHVQKYRLLVDAAVSGGPNATLDVRNQTSCYLDLNASNSYQGLTLVRSGGIAIGHSHALGSTNSGVIVTNTGTLMFGSTSDNATVTKAFLHLHAFKDDNSYATVFAGQSNSWHGPVRLGRDTIVKSWNRFTFNGPISGPGGLEITGDGDGEVVLAGAGPGMLNTYTGTTRVLDAILTLAKQKGPFTSLAIPGDVVVEGMYDDWASTYWPGRLRFAAGGQMPATARISIAPECSVYCAADTVNGVASLAGAGDVEFAPHAVLHAGFDNADFQFTGRLLGGHPADPGATCLVKQGNGSLKLSSTCTLTGAVEVVNGVLEVPGSLPNGTAYVRTNGTLTGTGQIRTVRVDGGRFWPGGAQGDLLVRSCTGGLAGLTTNGTLQFSLFGPDAFSGSDRLVVDSLADVENLRLNLLPGPFAVPVGEQFLIISNRSPNTVLGKLNHPVTGQNLDEGARFFAGNQRFSISYTGGDGNDVVATRVADPTPAHIETVHSGINGLTLQASGEAGTVYRIEAASGLGGTNTWTTVGTATMNNAGVGSFIDTDALLFPVRFYRFVAP